MIAGVFVSLYFQCSELGGMKWQISREISWLGFKVERRGFAQVDAGGVDTYRSLALIFYFFGKGG
jgi:hypothetical protein